MSGTRAEAGPPAATAVIGLGGNLGDRLAELRAGIAAIEAHPGLEVLAVSGVYESEYVGPGPEQPPYLNACAVVATRLTPRALLGALKGMERARGRVGVTHMRPRALDLDILLYGDLVMRTRDLEIPHPRLSERAFVLEPLAELGADRRVPDSGQTVGDLCAMIRAADGRTARRRPDATLTHVTAPD